MKMVKRLVAALLAGAMLMLLVGCSVSSGGGIVVGGGSSVSEAIQCMNAHRESNPIKNNAVLARGAALILDSMANEDDAKWYESTTGTYVRVVVTGRIDGTEIYVNELNTYVLTDTGLKKINGDWSRFEADYADLVYSMTDAKAAVLATAGENVVDGISVGVATKAIKGKTCMVIVTDGNL